MCECEREINNYLCPLKERVAPALWGFILDESCARAKRAIIWEIEWTPRSVVCEVIEYLHREDSLTQREWRALQTFTVDNTV